MRFRRTLISAAAAGLLATAGAAATGTALAADAPQLKLQWDNPREFYFLPPDGAENTSNEYGTELRVDSVGAEVHDVDIVYDLSSLKDKVTVDRLARGCHRTDWVVTCTDQDFTGSGLLSPFLLRSVKGVPLGEIGSIRESATSSNAGSAEHTRRVFNGKPEPRYGTHASYTIPDSERGRFPDLSPVIGNVGQVPVPEGVLLHVGLSDQDFTGERYSNCYYRTYQGAGASAYCWFATELAPGTAYTTDGVFSGATDPCCRVKGRYYYGLFPLGNPPRDWDKGTRGSGRVLGLKPVAASAAQQPYGTLPFISAGDWQTDWKQQPITLKGKLGKVTSVRVPYPQSLGPDNPWELYDGADGIDLERQMRVEVTLPEGVSLYPTQPGEQTEEDLCDYAADGHTVTCRIHDWAYLRVRFDKKVEGAQGSAKLVYPDDKLKDPDPSNNTAPVTADITGTPAPSTSPTPSPSPTPSVTPTPAPTPPTPTPTTGETPPTGSMAATGTPATPLLTTAAAASVALGTTLLAIRRRRT
ncbi:hypothetical protein [Streptomyces griseosporeus]|uniref:hypothetical protein n=1 Tax=Streptomyces griseosporeus TaxID=1910 RepID=UPI0036948D7D